MIRKFFNVTKEEIVPPQSSLKLKSFTDDAEAVHFSQKLAECTRTFRQTFQVNNLRPSDSDTAVPYEIIGETRESAPIDYKRYPLESLIAGPIATACKEHLRLNVY